MDCSCQEAVKLPKLVLCYVFLQREKVPPEEMLAMPVAMYNFRRIDLEEEFFHVQRRSRYDQEEVQGRALLRQLDQGVPPAALVLNDGGAGDNAHDSGQGMDVDTEESMDTDDQGAAAASTDESWRPSDPEDAPSPSSRPYNRQNRDNLSMTSLVKMHHGMASAPALSLSF